MRKGGWIPANHWGRLYLRGASAEVKLLACYLMTCAHSNAGGVVRANAALMASDLDISRGAVVDALESLVRRHFVVPYVAPDPVLAAPGGVAFSGSLADCWAWAVPAIVDAEPIANPNVGKRIAKDLADLLEGGQVLFWSTLWRAYLEQRDKLPAELVAAILERATAKPPAADDLVDAAALASRATVSMEVGTVGDVEIPADAVTVVLPAISVASCFLACPDALALANAWNTLTLTTEGAPLLLPVTSLDEDTLAAARERVAQLGGVDKIPVLMAKVRNSDVLMGRAPDGNGKPYVLTFAALCRESLFVKIMEGAYDPRPSVVTQPKG